jgi:hypothetical protein
MTIRKMFPGWCAVILAGVVNAGSVHAHEDAVLEWNRIAMEILNSEPPPIQMRYAAIVQLAVFEGVNAVTGDYESLVEGVNAPRDASAPAAAVSAAHRVMRNYYPDRATELDAARRQSLERIPPGPAREAGIAAGEAAAQSVIASRENDGSETNESFLPDSTEPGEWQLTRGCPPTGGVFLHWRNVKPFVIRSARQFRAPPPPSLKSGRYLDAYREVLAVGARDSTERPPDRTTVAKFYHVFGDAALWNPIARQLAQARRDSLSQNARTFALLNIALHDLAVALVETKYHYHFWRPETAIVAAGSDGNPRTEPDPSYLPLVDTPCHPSYQSGHAATSGVSREVLERIFGGRGHRIVITHPDFPDVVLKYATLEEITRDIDDARVYGGIHFRFDQVAGAEQGRRVGAYVWRHALRPDCCGDDRSRNCRNSHKHNSGC